LVGRIEYCFQNSLQVLKWQTLKFHHPPNKAHKGETRRASPVR
jgi:hypothetical protein